MNLAPEVTMMRLSLLSLLLLTAAAPALAQVEPEERTQEAGAREELRARSEVPERAAREFKTDSEVRRTRPERVERIYREGPREAAPERVREVTRAASADQWRRSDAASGDAPRARGDGWRRPSTGNERARPSTDRSQSRDWGWRGGGDERRARVRDIPPTEGSPVFGSALPSPQSVTRPSRNVSPDSVAGRDLRERIVAEGLRRERIDSDSWRRGWRQDRRYDWRRHRHRDRSRFHLGIYIDPFGSYYRDYDVGWRMPSRLYASRYWIADPWTYRLPPVAGPYRWVRYYDDVLLIDLRTGRVLDRIRGFFW